MRSVKELLDVLSRTPEKVEFAEVMEVIDGSFHYAPVAFRCGEADNKAGSNEGSCKILAFAKLHELDKTSTLNLFGRYYREDVVQNPQGEDHGNIRNFVVHGWDGVSFDAEPLKPVKR